MPSRYSYFGARALDDSEQCGESDLLASALFTRSKDIYKQGLHSGRGGEPGENTGKKLFAKLNLISFPAMVL
ncbi:hypothetical protein TNCV_972021 [Trichonephila clavipes]|nr:hypothetical protein TNCV_972021 [Trichonephila clavipes]